MPRSEVENHRRLKQVETHLTREFPDLEDGLVRREVRTVSAELLGHARFTDFVPLLVQRIVRERLRDHRAAKSNEPDAPARVAERSA